jgi:hypothetical protein
VTDRDRPAGHASQAARDAEATDDVQRNTKTQTTAASYTTTNHDVIRAWAEARGGVPASVEGTESGSDAGVLRIEFRDNPDLHEGSWDSFFEKFEEQNLAFVYQERTSDGEESRFNKIVSRNSEN